MRRKITVYGLRFSKTTFWNRINTGFLDPAVATVLTACGIETIHEGADVEAIQEVATVLTACGIETGYSITAHTDVRVATVLTACGIETYSVLTHDALLNRLQQYLPLAVLKRPLVSTAS